VARIPCPASCRPDPQAAVFYQPEARVLRSVHVAGAGVFSVWRISVLPLPPLALTR